MKDATERSWIIQQNESLFLVKDLSFSDFPGEMAFAVVDQSNEAHPPSHHDFGRVFNDVWSNGGCRLCSQLGFVSSWVHF